MPPNRRASTGTAGARRVKVLVYAPCSARQGAHDEGQSHGAPQFRQAAGGRTTLEATLSAAVGVGKPAVAPPGSSRRRGGGSVFSVLGAPWTWPGTPPPRA